MKKLLILMFCIFSVIFTGCSTSTTENTATKNQDVVLKIGLMPDIDSIPFIIAEKQGFFKEEGVNVEFQHFKSAMDRDSALQSGNLDGNVSDMLAAGFAKDGGFDVKITSATNGNYCLIAGTNNTATNISDMKGQNISISKNTIIEFVLDEILTQNNMTEADINKTIIPQIPTRLEMLQNGQLDGAVLPEPMGSIAVKNGSHFINSANNMKLNPGVMIFTTDSLDQKTDAIKAMYRAYNKAIDYLNNTPQYKYMDTVIAEIGLPPATKEALTMTKYEKATLPTKEDWERSINWLNKKELVSKSYKYDDIVSDILNQ